MTKRSLGLVGVGKIAVDQHFPSIAETGLFELRALVSRRGVMHAGLPTYRTQAEMFSALPDLDAVAICTPPDVRHGFVREALRAGKHVLMEKPPTGTVTEFFDLLREAERAGKSLFATWHSQFNAAVDDTKTRLAGERITRISVVWKEDVRRWHPGQEWIWEIGGFGVFDPGINALSILTKILPFPFFVADAELRFPANRETPIAAQIAFKAPAESGLEEFRAEFDWRQEGDQTWTITVETESGSILELSRGGTVLTVDGRETVNEAEREYRHIYRRFHELIASGARDVDGRPLQLVADAFLLGRRVEVEAFDW